MIYGAEYIAIENPEALEAVLRFLGLSSHAIPLGGYRGDILRVYIFILIALAIFGDLTLAIFGDFSLAIFGNLKIATFGDLKRVRIRHTDAPFRTAFLAADSDEFDVDEPCGRKLGHISGYRALPNAKILGELLV